MKASEYFKEVLDWLQTPINREFATRYVDAFPPYFMVNPASSTGKYHAPWSNTKGSEEVAGGLAKHTLAMCHVVKDMREAEGLTDAEYEAALIATLGHDAVKYSLTGGKYTSKTHEAEGALFFRRCLRKFDKPLPLSETIYNAILKHQGRWAVSVETVRFPEDFCKVSQLVHRADMFASRPTVKFTFLEEEESFLG